MKKLLFAALSITLLLGAVTSTDTRRDTSGDGSTLAFTFGFPAQKTSDIEVYVGGVKQVAGYTVTFAPPPVVGGTVTFVVAPGNTVPVRIQRAVPKKQEVIFTPYSAFPAKTMEKALDRQVQISQEVDRRVADAEATHAADKAALDALYVNESATRAAADSELASAFSLGTPDANLAQVTATGSTTPRPTKDRAADSVNVKDFGACGDGICNDTAAIQAALNKAAPNGKRVVLPRGVYRTTTTLNVGSNTEVAGDDATIKPDGSFNLPALQAWGAPGAVLVNITIRGIYMDGTNRPMDSTGGWGAFWFGYVNNLVIRDCSWFQTHDANYLRAVENFTISGLRVKDSRSAIVALLKATRRGTISDLQGVDVEEVVDFFDNEDVSVSNFAATGATARADEAFDVSTSRRITIANGTVTGFAYGLHIKTEEGQTDPSYSWQDIVFANVTIKEQTLAGILAQASVVAYGPAQRLRVSNVSIISSVVGSSGVSLTPPAGGTGAQDATFDGLIVDTPGVGFYAYQFPGIRLRNSRIKAAAGFAVQLAMGSNPDLVIAGNEIESTAGISSDAALYIENSDDVRVERNRVKSATGGYAIWIHNSKRPLVRNNAVENSGLYGIAVKWTSAAAIDVRQAGVIAGNTVRNWGQTTANRAGIYVSMTGFTATVEGLDVSSNLCTLTDAATLNNQYSFTFSLGTVTLDRSRYDANISGALVPQYTAAASGSAAFGAGCSKANNLPSTM